MTLGRDSRAHHCSGAGTAPPPDVSSGAGRGPVAPAQRPDPRGWRADGAGDAHDSSAEALATYTRALVIYRKLRDRTGWARARRPRRRVICEDR
jgi:hypothetical protein